MCVKERERKREKRDEVVINIFFPKERRVSQNFFFPFKPCNELTVGKTLRRKEMMQNFVDIFLTSIQIGFKSALEVFYVSVNPNKTRFLRLTL